MIKIESYLTAKRIRSGLWILTGLAISCAVTLLCISIKEYEKYVIAGIITAIIAFILSMCVEVFYLEEPRKT